MRATEFFLNVASGLFFFPPLEYVQTALQKLQRWTPASSNEQERKNTEEGTGEEEQGRMEEGQEQMSSDTGTSVHVL